MSGLRVEDRPNRVLIYTPFGRDGALLCDVLGRAGIEAEDCRTLENTYSQLGEGLAAALLIGEEALGREAVERLKAILGKQPQWSDLPVFVMTRPAGNETRYSHLKKLGGMGNISLLERPMRRETVVSAFKMALRARSHQYDLRDYIETQRQNLKMLARANAELRRANDDLSQFAFSASHDLREPLRMVAVSTQLLQQKHGPELSPDATRYIQFAVQGAQRMERLLKDLLSYTQVASAKGEGPGRADANEVLQQAVENLDNQIAETGAAIHAEKLPEVAITPVHLLQLFQNLIGNALKYRGDEPPFISIRGSLSKDEACFCVSDNGIGIDPQYAKYIFGVFKRLHGGHSKYEGTGIGLAICQRIVDRYGGRIWVESDGPNTGSSFFFTLPLAAQEEFAKPAVSGFGGS